LSQTFLDGHCLSSLLAYDEQHVSKKDEGVGGGEKKGYTFVKRNETNQVMKLLFQRLTDF
jgi:hypothetical protein